MIYLILLFALLLRLPLLDASFWLDEAAQYLESARPFSEQLSIREDFQPPLMHLLTFFSIRLGDFFGLGTSEWFIRILPSLLPGLITIYATYKLSLGLKFGGKTALLASLFLSTSSFHIFYSQELRPYSLPAMFALLSTWQLSEMILHRKWSSFWFVTFSILGLYSSYLYPFLLFGQFAYLLVQKFPIKRLVLSASFIAFSFLPWLPKFIEQLQTGQALRLSMPGWEEVVSLPQLKTAILVPLKFILGVSNLELNSGYLFLISSVLIPSIYLLVNSWRKNKKQLIFFICLLALPLLSSWLISFFIPVLQAKRVLFLLPFFSILLSYLIIEFEKSNRHISKILLSTVLIINLFSTYAYWTKPTLQRENWRGLSQEIALKFPAESTALVFAFDQPFAPWRLYDRIGYKTYSSGVFNTANIRNPGEQFKELTKYRYVLLFDYLRDLTDRDDVLVKVILDLGFQEASVLDYPNIGFVRIYSQERLATR